ncbi:MAG: hypothetical protein JEZ01_13065 [Labilibaculum sp.]|nr:PKD domain-containing protein [Labilibaculum sp.]MBI9058688.1 hypothetical protein [Labilibaculum sp.]
MNRFLLTLLLYILVKPFCLVGQNLNYKVDMASFCNTVDDEYSAIYYKEGLVFCSNQRTDLFVTFSTPEDKELFNMFYVPTKGDSIGSKPKLLSLELMTNFNDGPACFTNNDSTIIYSRNNVVNSKKRDVKDERNKLGLFTSNFKDDLWSEPEAFKYNGVDYHITMPSINKEGSLLFFASDMPGGYGGLDIYVSELNNGEWSKPKNLGDKVNTSKSESFPFISDSGELYFASNGHDGLGGLDLFSVQQKYGRWEDVLHLNAPINTEFDDFALITDKNFESGYLSSNRNGGDNIFEFSTIIPQFVNCDTIKENEYCFLFYDEYYTPLDTSKTYYEWVFGDGVKVKGKEAEHCYDGPGNYVVELNIIDKQTGEVFLKQTKYEFELQDYEQAYISSKDIEVSRKEILFEATKTNLPNINIEQYFWNYGDGNLDQGIATNHIFEKKGTYKVILGLLSEKDENGLRKKICVEKEVQIVKNTSALMVLKAERGETNKDTGEKAFKLEQLIELFVDQAILVQLPNNRIKILKKLNLTFFESFVKEKSFPLIDENKDVKSEIDLNSHPAKDLFLKSENREKQKSNEQIQLVEEELKLLSKQFDYNFIDQKANLIKEKANPILTRLLQIIMKNPMIELKIGFHVRVASSSDFDIASASANLIQDYLISEGVEKYRLRTAVYGISAEEKKSVSSERVEFIVIKE